MVSKVLLMGILFLSGIGVNAKIEPFLLGKKTLGYENSPWCPNKRLVCTEKIKGQAKTCESKEDLIAVKGGNGYQTKEGVKCRVANWTDMETFKFLKEAKEIDTLEKVNEEDWVKCIMTHNIFFPENLNWSSIAIKVPHKTFKEKFTQFEADSWNVECGKNSNMENILEKIEFFKNAVYLEDIDTLEEVNEDYEVKCIMAQRYSFPEGPEYKLVPFKVPIEFVKEKFMRFNVEFKIGSKVFFRKIECKDFSTNMKSILTTGVGEFETVGENNLTKGADEFEKGTGEFETTDDSIWWKKNIVKMILLVVVFGVIGKVLYIFRACDDEPEINYV